ncbi:MAG: 3-dehydroquinate synthase [Deltaproteobacteria bacterium]|nr:3-dehydroquinate synthase [Deltaproteobacteria bacterium]
MKKIKVDLGKNSYPLIITHKDLFPAAQILKKQLKEDRLFIITNPKLKKSYQKTLEKAFAGFVSLHWITVPDGEKHKTLLTLEKLAVTLSKKGANRQSALLAFGGGVVGDITGFLAASYMRGIDFYQMPTSLLAQVDSSVGGKTAVDLPTGKNLLGAFYQPKAVFIDTNFLQTLPKQEFACGMAEVIKYGMIADKKFFDFLKRHAKEIHKQSPKALETIIAQSCKIKAHVVSQDEKEQGLRAILNFGHTYGHALEQVTGFNRFKHGEAVALGMLKAVEISIHKNLCSQKTHSELKALLTAYKLPVTWPKINAQKLNSAMAKDKKFQSQNIRFILSENIGKVKIVPIALKELKQ